MSGFEAFPKIKRYANITATLTEKIDGTNAALVFDEHGRLTCQSRTRVITPGKETDNFGFASWAFAQYEELFEFFGPGRHYGEWYGQGIQRGYGMLGRRFAPFNTHFWNDELEGPWPEAVVPLPVLATVGLEQLPEELRYWTQVLSRGTLVRGSKHSTPSEGIMVYTDLGYIKAPFDPLPKGN